ncbi:PREDICTED: snaclec purpureotin subunit beta-like [Cyprinodon variegatus]|uniref:snaclec purpureotin subunit beta-like n=1 Tax=Cyprinodon variegatus TaxID=28743 RepID=UPI0007424EBF|nr:PREDICTED: snaclec purpureotin subunit beta-like [Cyprinodon variegatus]
MNWTDAQKYCRANHTDLASVRNQSENDAIEQLLMDNFAWIGLYSESWRWSDGQRLKMTSFSKWNPSQRVDVENSCVTTGSGVWNIRPCSNKYPFICSGLSNVQPIERKLVKITLSTSASSLDLEESQDAILQQLRSKLPEHGLGDLKLRWIKQSDGKTFHLKKKDKK